MRILKYLIFTIIILLGITFAYLNAAPVELHYYLGSKKIALSLLLVLTVISGAIFGLLASMRIWLRAKKENFRLRSRIKQIERDTHLTKF